MSWPTLNPTQYPTHTWNIAKYDYCTATVYSTLLCFWNVKYNKISAVDILPKGPVLPNKQKGRKPWLYQGIVNRSYYSTNCCYPFSYSGCPFFEIFIHQEYYSNLNDNNVFWSEPLLLDWLKPVKFVYCYHTIFCYCDSK